VHDVPPGNGFRHQVYGGEPANATYARITAPAPVGDAAWIEQGLGPLGGLLRRAGVRSVWLVHGTFAGTDAVGLFRMLARLVPGPARGLAAWRKRTVDALVGDAGNYTDAFARELEAGLNLGHTGARLSVHRFAWTGENHHLGRADAAVNLLEKLLDEAAGTTDDPGRVLVWAHSHGGNVLALVTNLLRATPALRRRFFQAARSHHRRSDRGGIDLPAWPRLEERLERGAPALPALDIVTFGTPVRYGWDVDVGARLLHVVNHRPVPGLPEYRPRFPPRLEAVLHATDGDVIQQVGIAGTDFPPPFLFWRARFANRRLRSLLERGVARQRLFARLESGTRVAADGITLLVDYANARGHVASVLPEPTGIEGDDTPCPERENAGVSRSDTTDTRSTDTPHLERETAGPGRGNTAEVKTAEADTTQTDTAAPTRDLRHGTGHVGQHLAGHAVYTRREWMLFHAEQVVQRFYGEHDPR
jgi:hypothetical protein